MSDTYWPTIGLEIHAELATNTKMFCNSKNDSNEKRPNSNVCPVCMAHPGTLPVINREAVRHVLRVGTAVGAHLADYTEFDRKNYFYPDLPKGYQLSQYEYPLVRGGELAGITLTRVHLEEDTASSMHDEESGETVIDYNRAGVPLMELVTEPVIHSAEEAGRFARELQLLLRYLGVSEANLEKGEMRVEANISVGKGGHLGTKVEIKNLNSFNAMERAVRYEIQRQTALLERGERVIQETLGWDEKKQSTFPQRIKEGSADYRYFPDPDLPSLKLSEVAGYDESSLRASLPELPSERRQRYIAKGVKAEDAELYTREPRFGDLYDLATTGLDETTAVLANNLIANDLVKIVRDIEERDSETLIVLPISPNFLKEISSMFSGGELSSRSAKDLLMLCIQEKGTPRELALAHGLMRTNDSAQMASVVEAVIAEHATIATEYREGKEKALEFLLGQSMRALKGAGDPVALRSLLKEKLKV